MARTLKIIALTLVIGAALEIGGAWTAAYYGMYDVAAIVPDPWPVATALHYVSDRAVAVRLGDIKLPVDFAKTAQIEAGGLLFGQTCATCHTGPGQAPSRVTQGLNPAPPNLFMATRDAEAEETYWFIRNGVKMSGMPGFAPSLTDAQIWSLTAFVAHAPAMTPAHFSQLTGLAITAAAVGK